MYVELHAASAFSFLDGASLPEALVERAAALGYPALALLDRDGFYGAPRFHLAAKKAGLKAIIGVELTVQVAGGSRVAASGGGSKQAVRDPRSATRDADAVFRLPVLVESQAGYRNLCRLLTMMKLRSTSCAGCR